MGRWRPGARSRLEEAALELFLERGFEQTMVVDIGERAGVTARTFFRHFADKREVLFEGAGDLETASQDALDRLPASAPALGAVGAAIEAVARLIDDDRDRVRRRQAVIAANPELRERELVKLSAMADTLSERLQLRGIGASEASLAAAAGLAVYKVAFAQWITGGDEKLSDVFRAKLAELTTLVNAT